MIAKKNPKADLEKKRFAFFQIGLIIAGSSCLAAFEYSTASVAPTEQVVMAGETFTLPVEPIYEVTIAQPQKMEVVQEYEDVKVVDHVVIESKEIKSTEDDIIKIDEDDDGDRSGEGDFTYVEILPEEILPVAEVEPTFPGGFGEMGKFINSNIELPNHIPDYDQGTVYVQFVVNKDGSIEQVGVIRGLSKELNESAMEVVRNMPKWSPGEQAGKPVRVRFTVPISIILN